jgi:hypothetical protein
VIMDRGAQVGNGALSSTLYVSRQVQVQKTLLFAIWSRA